MSVEDMMRENSLVGRGINYGRPKQIQIEAVEKDMVFVSVVKEMGLKRAQWKTKDSYRA